MLHGPVRGPASEERNRPPVVTAAGHPNQPVMKAEEIKPGTTDLQMHYPRLGFLWFQTKFGQPSLGIAPHPEGCTGQLMRRAQDAAPVSGVSNYADRLSRQR